MATQHGARLVFDNAKRLVENAGFNVNQAVLSQSYLRSEVAISTSVTNYHIPILINDTIGTAYATEQRLQLQDAFVLSSLGVFVAEPDGEVANFKLYSYASPQLTNAAALTTLWNSGSINMVFNNRQIMPAWDVYRHYEVPQTQYNTQGGANAGIDQISGANTGLYPVEPNVVLVGSKNLQVSLTLPEAISDAGNGSRIVVIFRGILAQNVTPVR